MPSPPRAVYSRPADYNPNFYEARSARRPSTPPHTPREKYRNYRCELCERIGHIKWSCNLYECPYCGLESPGHKPQNCSRRSPPARLRGGSSRPETPVIIPGHTILCCGKCRSSAHLKKNCPDHRCKYCKHYAPGHKNYDCPERPSYHDNSGQYDVIFEDNMDGEC